MDYVKLKSRSTIQGFIVTLAALLALSIGMVGLAGCSSGTSDEDAIRASLSSELDSIKNIDDAFVNEFSESIDMSQLSVYGIDGVEFMKSYLSGFDYTIDSINVDGDSATAQITLTCKSYTGYLQALQTAVDEVPPIPMLLPLSPTMRSTKRSARSSSAPSTASSWRPPSPSPSPTPRSTAPGSRPRPPRATSRPR